MTVRVSRAAAVAVALVAACAACGSSGGSKAAPTGAPAPATGSSGAATGATVDCAGLTDQAEKAASASLSYDYHDLAASLAAVKALTTAAEYARETQLRATTIDSLAVKNHAVLTTTAKAVGYVDGGCAHPRVLIAATTRSTSTASTTASTQVVSLLLTFVQQGGRYLLDATAAADGSVGETSTGPGCPSAAAVASRIVGDTLAYNYQAIDAELAADRASLTGAALANFDANAAAIKSSVTTNMTVTSATTLAEGYEGGGCAAPKVLVVLTVDDTNSSSTQSQIVEATLAPHGGDWQVSALSAISAPSS